jgi:hypothetical protein
MTNPVKWTIMAYINADNILANFAVESLKQLRNAASPNVTVIAEFDDNQQSDARLYRFDGDEKKRNLPLDNSLIPEEEIAHLEHIHNVDMTNPDTLTEFIDFATKKSQTERYCLILWGHGIELLLDEDRRFGDYGEPVARYSASANSRRSLGYTKPASGKFGDDAQPPRRYLSAADLGKALAATNLAKGNLGPDHPKTLAGALGSNQERKHTLDIIGMDACSMSMIEVASAVQDYADFMIASQEDVPDASFPYEKILQDLRDENVRGDVKKVCELIPRLYKLAFRDYITTPNTGVKGITLASLNLQQTNTIADPLSRLSSALLAASYDTTTRKIILSARQNSKDFVFGILVDLGDFCECLEEAFAYKGITDSNLQSACVEIQKGLQRGNASFVLANEVSRHDNRCQGVSIYLPYRDDRDETDNAEEQFFKGSAAHPTKGSAAHPTKGSAAHPTKERIVRIQELEADVSKLKQFRPTGWMDFIKGGWSLILANEVQFDIDYYYSAEQCAANLATPHAGRATTKAAA